MNKIKIMRRDDIAINHNSDPGVDINSINVDIDSVNQNINERDTSRETGRFARLKDAIGGAAISKLTGRSVERVRKNNAEYGEMRQVMKQLESFSQDAKRILMNERFENGFNKFMRRNKFEKGIARTAIASTVIFGTGLLMAAAENLAPGTYAQATSAASDLFEQFNGSDQYSSIPNVTDLQYDPSVYSQTYLVGGNGDPTGEYMRNFMGGIDGTTIQYPASIAPAGTVTMADSIANASPKLGEIFSQAELNPGTTYDIHGFSLGSVTTAQSAQDYIANGGTIGDNVNLNLYGSPNIPNTGIFSGGSIDTVRNITDAAGIISNTEVPDNATFLTMNTDFFSMAGGDTPKTSQIAYLSGLSADGHLVPVEGQNATLTNVTNFDNGVTVNAYDHLSGPQHPALRAAEANVPGFDAEANPALSEFTEAIAPTTYAGSPDIPKIETSEVVSTGAAMIDEQLAVHNQAPIYAEQFVSSVPGAADVIAQTIDPVVQELNKPLDFSVINTPEVGNAVAAAQELVVQAPQINAQIADLTAQAQALGIQVPQF